MLFKDSNYKTTLIISIITTILLIIFGILYSMFFDFSTQARYIKALTNDTEGLNGVVEYMAYDVKNIAVIANRYLGANDDTVIALQSNAGSMLNNNINIADKAKLFYATKKDLVKTLEEKLSNDQNFNNSVKDKSYFEMLKLETDNLVNNSIIAEYNKAINEFNLRKSKFPYSFLSIFINTKNFVNFIE